MHLSREELRVPDLQNTGPHQCDLYGKLRAAGYTDYLIVPLAFNDGTINTLSIATRCPAGFSDPALDSFRVLNALIAAILERFAAVEATSAALGTYLGRNASREVMRGKIRAGHGELVKAAVLFADLRGFTALAAR